MRFTIESANSTAGVVLAFLLLSAAALAEAPFNEADRLEPWDASSISGFGFTVAASDAVAVVGAEFDGTGSVYVYQRIAGGWSPWTKLTASGISGSGWFGSAVAVSPDRIVVGAIGDGAKGIMAGAAFVFEPLGATWTQTGVLRASDGATQDNFGAAVAVEGDVLFVGAPGDDDGANRSGSAYVFEKVGGAWTQTAKVVAADPSVDAAFGLSIALSGARALIGARGAKSAGGELYHGAVYAVEKVGGTWTQVAKVNSSDSAPSDEFGGAVALAGDVAVIGAAGDDDVGSRSGSAYVFERIGGVWTELAKLVASDGASDDQFGCSVAASDSDVVIGAYRKNAATGAAYLFRDTLGAWTELARMHGSDAASLHYFGIRVAVSHHVAVIGTSGNQDIAYSFDLDLRPYGDGCAGTGGVVPRLRGAGDTDAGSTAWIRVEDGQPSAVGILFAGVQKVTVPAGFGCNLLVGPLPPLGLPISLDGAGRLTVGAPVPAGLTGLDGTLQAFVADVGVPPGYATTNGLGIEFR